MHILCLRCSKKPKSKSDKKDKKKKPTKDQLGGAGTSTAQSEAQTQTQTQTQNVDEHALGKHAHRPHHGAAHSHDHLGTHGGEWTDWGRSGLSAEL